MSPVCDPWPTAVGFQCPPAEPNGTLVDAGRRRRAHPGGVDVEAVEVAEAGRRARAQVHLHPAHLAVLGP